MLGALNWLHGVFVSRNTVRSGGGTTKKVREGRTKQQFDDKTQQYWRKELRHDGVRFPRAPQYQGLTLRRIRGGGRGVKKLSPEAEEFAVMYARALARRPALERDDMFQANFWMDFAPLMNASKADGSARDWDFAGLLVAYTAACQQGEATTPKATTPKATTLTAVVDGRRVPVGRCVVDGPGIYTTRSASNVLRGRLRRRLTPLDITVNLSHPTQQDRLKWGAVVTDNTVSWIARWTDPATHRSKYAYLGDGMTHRDQQEKFDVARRYGEARHRIMKRAHGDLSASHPKDLQCALCYIILDAFAIRPGSAAADGGRGSVRGVTTLRKSDVTLRPNNRVALDFIGKDSVRYMGEMPLTPRALGALRRLLATAAATKRLFPAVTAATLNAYLDEMMPGLTAKVIRTFRASCTYQQLLYAKPLPVGPIDAQRRLEAAAIGAAMMCNHQHETRECAPRFAPAKDVHAALKSLQNEMKQQHKTTTTTTKQDVQCWAKQTTLANYIDPRITVAYCRRYGVPIEHVYSGRMQARFKWALGCSMPYRFCLAEAT